MADEPIQPQQQPPGPHEKLAARGPARIAILVIADTSQPVYLHYIASYWTELIRHVGANVPHIDVYLLTEHGRTTAAFAGIADYVIEDPDPDVGHLVPRQFRNAHAPGILSKTIHAFDVLNADYDVFFRTNLSSIVKLAALDRVVQSNDHIGYAGGLVWNDGLRAALAANGHIGLERSVTHVAELDPYPGNTFISGSGFLLSAAGAASLVERRGQLRYDLPDDVAIGLMFEQYRQLTGFSEVIDPGSSIQQIVDRIRSTPAVHVRLERFPVERAMAVWRYVHAERWWL